MSSKLRRVLLVLAIAALLVVPFAAFTQAQDTTLTTCDSTLLLLVTLAERDYGYTSMMDLTTFERGQFGMFAGGMNMGGDMSMATPDSSTGSSDATADPALATPDASTSTDATVDPALATPADSSGSGGLGSFVQLFPGNVTGEDPNCAALRADVESYLFNYISTGGMNMNSGMGGSDISGSSGSGDAAVTAEPTTSG
jgi:hypothetical protein